MKLQKTRKSLLQVVRLLLARQQPPRYGVKYHKWAMTEMEEKYPLFHWAVKDEDKP